VPVEPLADPVVDSAPLPLGFALVPESAVFEPAPVRLEPDIALFS
jgi:hypothetical protein